MHKARFAAQKSASSLRNLILSLLLFAVVIVLFQMGLSLVTQKESSHERTILEQAISRDLIRCYALEGSYPQSLEYLVENYGLTYDSDRFFIDYRSLGSNLRPDVTIIDREEAD